MLVGNGNGGFCRRTCGRCGEREDATDSFGGGYDDDYFGDGGGEDEEDFGACACTEDGVSGGVDTDQIGCFDVSAEVVVSMIVKHGLRCRSVQSPSPISSTKCADEPGRIPGESLGAYARPTLHFRACCTAA